jgi:alpha-tubulin suppressor-like RCC1 family protein
MVIEAIAGGEHTLYSKDGALASAGACGLGWCRLLSLNPSLFRFRAVPLPEPASLVHASYYHNLAVGKSSGLLYSWGCGTFTEGGLDGVIPALGQGKDAEDTGALPKVVDMPMETGEFIKHIAGGAYHSAVLMNTGKVFTFGAGQLGQLGRSIQGVDSSGLPVDPLPGHAAIQQKVKRDGMDDANDGIVEVVDADKIGAGFYNTFAICNKGKLYCTGENQNEQCGVGPKNLHSFAQVREVGEEIVDQVEGGYCHTLVKTITGKVLSFGCGDDGQRGDGRVGDDSNRPVVTPIEIPVAAQALAAGANHSVILGENGKVYAFGANDVGQCGVPSDPPIQDEEDDDDDDDEGSSVLAPKEVELPKEAGAVIRVSAGYAHTVLTTESGKIFVFGQNDSGQLGVGAESFERGEEPKIQTRPILVET